MSALTWAEKVAYIGCKMEADTAIVKPYIDVKHIFEPGVYIREITIPAGVVFIGRPHRYGHRIRFLEGSFRLITPSEAARIEAPYEIETHPGFLMVLETYTHHVGRTYHPNPDECRDTNLMEGLIFHSHDEVRRICLTAESKIQRALA